MFALPNPSRKPDSLHGRRNALRLLTLALLFLAPILVSCQTAQDVLPNSALPALIEVNQTVNRQGAPCPGDSCLDDWPEPADLSRLDYWDCKAYSVAKAEHLIHQHGYDPARLEYVLISGPPLRVTHAALLVDGEWVLDNGLRCQVCDLQQFAAGVKIDGRLPVMELRYVRQALGQMR